MWRGIASNALTLFIVLLVVLAGLIGWGRNEFVKAGPLTAEEWHTVKRHAEPRYPSSVRHVFGQPQRVVGGERVVPEFGGGSTTTWYWRTMPPTDATSATFGNAFSSNFRNQSWIERSWARSCLPVRSTSAYW